MKGTDMANIKCRAWIKTANIKFGVKHWLPLRRAHHW